MNPQAEVLKKRSKQFALDVLAFVRSLSPTVTTRIIGEQLIRSATGTPSTLWLEILAEGGITKTSEALRLLDEANQLSAIFARSRITSIEGMKRRKESREGRDARLYLKRV